MDKKKNQFSLLFERRFGPFFVTQALGAFNDNVFKNALVILIGFHGAALSSVDPNILINLSALLFILPFFLFSATAGQVADKLEKAQLIRWIKLLELFIMLLAGLGFYLNSLPLLIGVLFLMGTQSTLFGPIKYSILPQQLRSEELVGGNALVETGTFLAILVGTILASALMSAGDASRIIVSLTVLVVAAGGYLSSRSIPPAPPPEPELKINYNPVTETWRNFRFMVTNPTVFRSVLGISWFWFFGAVFLTQMTAYSKNVLGGAESSVGVLLALFSVGIATGSLLCERLSDHKVEIGLVPLGSIGLTLFALDLYFATPTAALATTSLVGFITAQQNWHLFFDLLMIGISGGLYIVPLYALIQERSEQHHVARIIAGNNILNALFMVFAAALGIVVLGNGLSIPTLFLITAILNAAVTTYIFLLVPEFLVRFVAWLLMKILYRVHPSGIQEIPDQGPAILVCNHVSFVDALIIMGTIRRPARFVMFHTIFKMPLLGWLFRAAKAIPIAPHKEDPALLERAYDEIHAALSAGDLVCVFPEGSLTPDGNVQAFKSGVERMVERDPVPVVPMALTGLWGSLFSRRDGPLSKRRPRRFRSHIGLNIGLPVGPENVTAAGLQHRVEALRG